MILNRSVHTVCCAAALLMMTMIGLPGTAAAQDRMPPIPAERLTEAQKKAVEEFKAARGSDVSGPFIPLLRSPEVMTRARAMGDYLRFKSALPPKLSELVILISARHWTQRYEWAAHAPIALAAGVDPEVVKAIAEGRRPDHLGEDEQTLHDFCAELFDHQSVSDATYARMLSRFGEQGVIDTIGIMGYYSMLAMVLNVSRTPPGASAPALRLFPQ